MALNFGDVALNLAAGAIDKDEKYRQEALEQRYKELADNKQLYRALATTRYSKDLDKRDKWWVMRSENLVDTLEQHSGRKYLYLHDEIINTRQKLNLNHLF